MELIDQFLEFEEKYNLLQKKIDGYYYWRHHRFQIYQEIQEKKTHNASADLVLPKVTVKDRAVRLMNKFVIGKRKNPLLFKGRCDVLVLNHERRMYIDGLYRPIYFESILKDVKNFMILEPPNMLQQHYSPISYERETYYTDLMEGMVTLYCKTHTYENKLLREELDKIFIELANYLSVNFDVEKLKSYILRSAWEYPMRKKYYEKILNKCKPKVILEVVSYNRDQMIVNELAKKQGIPTLELQHGTMGRYHIAYNYSGKKDFPQFPDKVLLFSKYWKNVTRLPQKDENILVTGYPYMEEMVRKYKTNKKPKKNTILFISQKPIGRDLSKFAVALLDKLKREKEEYRIIYKLHPAECPSWEEDLPELYTMRNEIEVISDSSVGIYQLFSESTTQIGVYSTAIFEGLAFGLKTYILDAPGKEYMQDLYQKGYAQLVEKPDEINDEVLVICKCDFWEKDSITNIQRVIRNVQ